jgi:hypothetical protein
MGKTSTPWRPVNQSASTHPTTRVVDASKSGQAGSVAPSKQPLPSVAEMESRSQKTPRPQIPVTLESVTQLTPGDKDGVPSLNPVSASVEVKTEH